MRQFLSDLEFNEAIDNTFRSSPSEVFLGKDALKICNRFTGDHPCHSVPLLIFLCFCWILRFTVNCPWKFVFTKNTGNYRTFYVVYSVLCCRCILISQYYTSINPFLANVFSLCTVKIPENLWFSGIFRGYKMGPLARSGLK